MLDVDRGSAVVRQFVRAPGLLLEPLDDVWGAYSSLSGETHLLNDESVAIIEALNGERPCSAVAVSELLSLDCGLPVADVERSIGEAWDQLIEAGLIREQASTSYPVQ